MAREVGHIRDPLFVQQAVLGLTEQKGLVRDGLGLRRELTNRLRGALSALIPFALARSVRWFAMITRLCAY